MKKAWFLILALLALALPLAAQEPAGEPIGPDPMALDVDYMAYEAAMTTKPTAQWQAATNALFHDWKNALGVDRLDEVFDVLYLFTAETEQAALLNAAKRDHDATNNGMAFTRRVGFQGDGEIVDPAHIATGYVPTTDGVAYAAADALFGVHSWSPEAASGLNPFDMGWEEGGTIHSWLVTRTNTNTTRAAVNGAIGEFANAGDGEGLFLAQRTGTGTNVSTYRNGESLTLNSGGDYEGAAPGTEVYIGCGNVYSGGANVPLYGTSRQLGAAFIGRSLSAAEHADVYEAWDAYLTAIATEAPPVYPIYLPVVGTNAIMQIFDRTGVPVGEILPEIDYVSWRRNEIGQAVFALAKSDPKANDVFLRAQNRVLVTFDNGLPPWGGILQPEFTIDHNKITVRALTGESLLLRRLTDRGRYFSQETIGGITSALITEAAAVWPLGIGLGNVWGGGDRHSPSYHYKDLLTIFKESLFKRLSAADFYAEPFVGTNGRLSFTLHVVERRGRDIPGVALHQGLNVVDPTKVSYTGPIINHWTIVGDGQGWGADRPVAVAEDLASIDRYGRLEASEIHQGVIFQETLQATADNLLAETAWPRVILDITAVDAPPATFEQYGVGDTLAVELPDYGIGSSFVGAATVMARAFYPKDGRLNLVLEATASA